MKKKNQAKKLSSSQLRERIQKNDATWRFTYEPGDGSVKAKPVKTKKQKPKPVEIVLMEWRWKKEVFGSNGLWQHCSTLYNFGYDVENKDFRLATYRRIDQKD